MEVRRLMARVCTISIPTGASKGVQNGEMIGRIDVVKMRFNTEGANIHPLPLKHNTLTP